MIDYLYAVPPRSSGKGRAALHGIVNSCALLAFGLGWLFRDTATLEPGWGTVALEGLGSGLLLGGGWLGGTLVFRNQIGVDHRHADAAKWSEQTVEGKPGDVVAVARADELAVGQMKLLHVAGRRIVLGRTPEGHVAFDDRCPHRGGPLADGVLIDCTVACPWHGSRFDVRTGQTTAGPAEQPIGTFPAEEVGGEVRLRVPAGSE